MSKKSYFGVNGVARNVKSWSVGVGNVARKVKNGYFGVGGVARQFLSGINPVPVLNNNDWATIRAVSDEGTGANYWNVGDYKNIQISGTVQGESLNMTVRAFIIGFDHNYAKEGSNRIHFQIGKTTSGKNIAFCASEAFTMNQSNTNVGGWRESYGRNTLLGNRGTPTSPPSNSFMKALPSDLRAVMKSVTKYTDNIGGGKMHNEVTATTDYLFLLSEFEIQGSRYYANSSEKNYQAQYDYYKAGNSKVKYRHDATSTAVSYWCRSVAADYAERFCYIYTSGVSFPNSANSSLGLAPGFCV